MIEADITSEEWREYVYADGSSYRIDKPGTLYLKETNLDSHRVVDCDEITHYPKNKWIAIRWKANPAVSF